MNKFEIASILVLCASVIAVIASPIIALAISRSIEKSRERSQRRYDVFCDLMKTRVTRLDPTHVSALNLVELEFYDNELVRVAYRNYIRHLSSPMPVVDQQDRYFDARAELFADMMKEMGSALGFHFDKQELTRLGYAPQGWEDDQASRQRNAALLSKVLNGEQPLTITQFMGGPESPFPEPPRIEDK